MKKEITLGEFIATIAVLLIALIGWGVSVEIRLTTHRVQIETIMEMKVQINDIHKKVIQNEKDIIKESMKSKI